MLKYEKKSVDWLIEKKNIIFFVFISAFSIFIRLFGLKHISFDMEYYLIPWFEEIMSLGKIKALSAQVGNYNIIYQTIIALITYLPVSPVYSYKFISIFFDFLLAFSSALLVVRIIEPGDKIFSLKFNIVYSIVLCIPTIILNSSIWGQCDSIYTCMVILALLFLFEKKYVKAFLLLGLGFAFKLQTVFILPFFIAIYLYRRDFSFIFFLFSIFIFWLTGLPGFIQGRSISAPFEIYLSQAYEMPGMWFGYPSFWMIIGDDYTFLGKIAVLFVVILCGLAFYCIISNIKNVDSAESFLNTAAWFVWTCVLFLPKMRDRYSYMLDVILILLTFINYKYIYFSSGALLLSMISYGKALYVNPQYLPKSAAVTNLILYILFSVYIIKKETNKNFGEVFLTLKI